jgi:transposase
MTALAKVMDIKLLGCMAHIRRYFEKALSNDITRSECILFKIQDLYKVERKPKEEIANQAAIKTYRQKHAKPILE